MAVGSVGGSMVAGGLVAFGGCSGGGGRSLGFLFGGLGSLIGTRGLRYGGMLE